MVCPVEETMRRTRSISSPKNSRRTGEVACAGKMSTESPWMWKVPGTSVPSTLAYPMPTSRSTISSKGTSSPTAKVELA